MNRYQCVRLAFILSSWLAISVTAQEPIAANPAGAGEHLDKIEERVKELEARMGRTTQLPTSLNSVEKRLQNIEKQLAALERDLERLEIRLKRLETRK